MVGSVLKVSSNGSGYVADSKGCIVVNERD